MEMMEGVKRALVISAHPDDVDFGCSGAVALLCKRGVDVLYVICTNGDKGTRDPDISREELIETRKREQMEAAKTVGVHRVEFLGFEDGELENTHGLRMRLVEAMRAFRPDIVICQDPGNRSFENPYVSHRDHRMAAEAAFDAMYPASGNSRFFPELSGKGLRPHSVREAYFFGTHAPNYWVDITEVIDLKISALRCHRSQLGDRLDVEKFVRERFSEAGRAAGYPYAEPFRRLLLPG